MSRAAKTSAVRSRHATTVKTTIDTVNALTATADSSELSVMREELESNWSDYSCAFNEHEDAIVGKNDDEVTTINAEFSTIHTAYVKARVHLTQLMTASTGPAPALESTIIQHDGIKTVKLPPCKLMKFSGELTEWVEFEATCRSMLTDKVSEVQRLQFLKDALVGEPRALIAHVMPHDGAYDRAMLLLKGRYKNVRAIVNAHLKQLYNVPRNEPDRENKSLLRSIVDALNGLKAGLEGCAIDTSTWDSILIYNTVQCLHPNSLRMWEEHLNGQRTVPTLKTYLQFLETRIMILETTQSFGNQDNRRMRTPQKPVFQKSPQNKEPIKALYTLKSEYKCVICGGNHIQTRCNDLSRTPVHKLMQIVQDNKLCANCFQFHAVEICPFTANCRKCSEFHHTLLHPPSSKVMVTRLDEADGSVSAEEESDAISKMCSENFYHVSINSITGSPGSATLLATAIVPIRWNGRSILVHALIDLGATANLISERACKALDLPVHPTNIPMTGVGDSPVGRVTGFTMNTIGSVHDDNFNLNIASVVVKRIANTPQLDRAKFEEWPHLHNLLLADPEFLDAHKIDLLLGASACAEIMLPDQRKSNGKPMAQETTLGYIVYGPIESNENLRELCYMLHNEQNKRGKPRDDLASLLKAFWEIEEVESVRCLTRDEQAAEDVFVKSLKRASDGKFMVDLPFKVDPTAQCLGQSREMALRRLRASQRRFAKNPEAKRLYDQNLREYLSLGHMVELKQNEVPRNFLPHHPVVKESSSTTKVRTVFDASAKTSNGLSLNEILYVGPTIQPDLFELLIQWRLYEFAFCGDIEKMYRQIWVNPDHALFQCILWQPPDSEEIKTYKLETVTFGTASAPFQAIRALDEIGIRLQSTNPEVSELIRKHFYVDDFLGSANSVEKASEIRECITQELAPYGFNLRKWKANDERILSNLGDSERDGNIDFFTTFKTLGIFWQPSCDSFQFKSTQPMQIEVWTRRSVLSEIAKLFDPLKWLAPCVAQAKMVMQEIWKSSTANNWDTPLPNHLIAKWAQVYEQLCLPIPIQVTRWLGLMDESDQVEIHGFCDASTKAYAAAVYIKISRPNGQIITNLVAAKTKLAPIKTVSIPRLELCGAVLLTKLFTRCVKALSLNNAETHVWTDSMIVLAWIAACPSRWSTFVAHRVTTIQTELPSLNWKHVPTEHNPADIASRGAMIHELVNSKLWWHGPKFLSTETDWPDQTSLPLCDDVPETKKEVQIFRVITPESNDVLERFSKLTSLLRFTAYAMRWCCREKRFTGPLKASEIARARLKWTHVVQQDMFAADIDSIKRKNKASTSVMQQLSPFIDSAGVLRMNGRVGNADIMHQKTAIILPDKHHFTKLIIEEAHTDVLHGGVQLTLRKLRDTYWIIHARSQVQKVVHKCITCFRDRKPMMGQKMADLPPFRTEQARPFAFVGCDYAGFFHIKTSTRRNSPLTKAYIALFICMTTKAIHLELVCDLSTAEFVMAFENFVARRGMPQLLYTDNGTNFIGAAKEIKSQIDQMFAQNNSLTRMLAKNNIEFKTIPARAPHMGGLWERAVGSVKYHLRRVLKETKLNARQFDHVLKQIEACLNSRPLWAVSGECDDVEVITPSHFFNFQAITTLPRPDIAHIPINRLDQYQYLYRLYCDFWKAWANEYLHQFQSRTKWQLAQPNAVMGQIVLVSEDNLPPSKWAYGKIVNTYPAKDGLVRAVDVKCGKNVLRRPIHKLALLPTPDNEKLAEAKDVEPMESQGAENVDAKCQQ